MAGIQFGGLASGLDTGAIIAALMQVEQIPIKQIEGQKKAEQTKVDLIGTLQGHVKALRDKAKSLSTLAGFMSSSVSISDPTAATVKISGSPNPSSHTLIVNSLASAERYAFDGVADAQADLGAGTIAFSYGGTAYSIAVAADASSLEEIAGAINDAAGSEVNATVVNAGTGTSPSWQLVLTGKQTGADYQITGLGDYNATLVGPTELTNASNASIVVDGLAVERSTNTFSDVIAGVSIDVLAADPLKTVSFTTSVDTAGIETKLKEFVAAYNKVIEFINQQSEYDPEDENGAPALFGDTLLSSVRREMQGTLLGVDLGTVQADAQGYSTLSLVGIKLKTDGTLEIDATKLKDKLTNNVELFADLFVDTDGFDNGGAAENTPEYYQDATADSGLLENLWRNLDKLTESKTASGGQVLKGLFAARTETLKANIDRYSDRIEEMEARLETYEEFLIAKFSALEKVMAGLTNQQNALLGF